MKDYYSILGLTYPSTKTEIKKTYRRLSKIFHPDMNGGENFYETCFKEIKEAYDALISAPNVVNKELVETTTSKIKYFYSDVRSVKNRETVKLSWSTQHCTNISINAFGSVPPTGSLEITIDNPNEEYTLVLSAVGEDGETMCQYIYLNVFDDLNSASVYNAPSHQNQVDTSKISIRKNKEKSLLVPLAGVSLILTLVLSSTFLFNNSNYSDHKQTSIAAVTNKAINKENKPPAKCEIPQEFFAMKASLIPNNDKVRKMIQKEEQTTISEKKINKKPLRIAKNKPLVIHKKQRKATQFAKGSTLKQVLAAQGIPSSMKRASGNILLQYGSSSILIEKGVVTSIRNNGNLRLSKKINTAKHFSIGSSKQLVLSVQGYPSSTKYLGDYELLHYGSSVISIVDGKVTAYTNNGDLNVI